MKIIASLIILLMTTAAFARAPEFLYQPADEEHAVNLSYAYRSFGIDFKDSDSVFGGEDWEWNWVYNIIGLRYDWGITDNFSIGAGFDYIAGNLEFTFPGLPTTSQRDWNIDGVESLDLNFKGMHGFGFFNLHYGLLADISLEEQNYSTQTARDGLTFTGRDNSSKGRHEFTPYIAFNMKSGRRNYGLKLAYQYNAETTHNFEPDGGPNSEVKYEGGHGTFISLYYEAILKDESTYGVAVNYQTFENQEVTESTGAPNVGDESKDYEYSTDGFQFDAYGNVKTSISGLEFIPTFSYILSEDDDFEGAGATSEGEIKSTGGSYKIEFKLRKVF